MKTAPESRTTPQDVARLVNNHQVGVWRYLRALGCSAAEADDFTQETFLIVLQKPFKDFSPAATASYLRRIAHNLLVTAQRRRGKVTVVENVEELDRAWAEWSGEDQGEELLANLKLCMEQLTKRARHALEMRFREKQSRSEIAGALEITEHGAKNLMQRAKKQLRTCIESKMK